MDQRRPAAPLHSGLLVLEPQVSVEEVAEHLPPDGPAGVKDGFAALDLADLGLAPLFDATWLHRAAPPAGPTPAGWSRVRTVVGLAAWNAAYDTDDVIFPDLLDRGHLAFLARWEGSRITARFVARLGTGVVDVSNVFADPGDDPWPEVVAVAAATFPGRALVGYEHGPDLTAALAAGFEGVGTLRVWAA